MYLFIAQAKMFLLNFYGNALTFFTCNNLFFLSSLLALIIVLLSDKIFLRILQFQQNFNSAPYVKAIEKVQGIYTFK